MCMAAHGIDGGTRGRGGGSPCPVCPIAGFAHLAAWRLFSTFAFRSLMHKAAREGPASRAVPQLCPSRLPLASRVLLLTELQSRAILQCAAGSRAAMAAAQGCPAPACCRAATAARAAALAAACMPVKDRDALKRRNFGLISKRHTPSRCGTGWS